MSVQWYKIEGIENVEGVKKDACYCFPISIHIDDYQSEILKILDDVADYPFTVTKISETSSCFGCRNDSPDQKSHMALGGCLYNEDLDSF